MVSKKTTKFTRLRVKFGLRIVWKPSQSPNPRWKFQKSVENGLLSKAPKQVLAEFTNYGNKRISHFQMGFSILWRDRIHLKSTHFPIPRNGISHFPRNPIPSEIHLFSIFQEILEKPFKGARGHLKHMNKIYSPRVN